MRGIAKLTVLSLGILAAASPVAAETWTRFSASDSIIYIVDQDTLTATDGVTNVRFARIPAKGDATDLSHELEEVAIRCSDGQSRTVSTVTHGPDGAETDRYADESDWDATPSGGVYGGLKAFACEDMRPQGKSFQTIAAFVANGRGD
ncbi:hypothetical protein [Brevundimonas sp. SL130]|uniref:hypothetical protein n=1 Tax=Brevundimonas sp. SL130 TaxID=2995143 RepID=UPI00226CE2F4|nr:hypothetical protein [Brevundimonas sp. SL130]WAC59182.1 hypothetical protein OU998_13280 [Brevundimonas sp. SL130]